ncbi:MAG TPA: gliding motility-associated C-terminal domain-containing protein, partial [Salinivirga sp.]|uniref:T9SS type B sorting domain-containing protein n=1 Tax=Salinivirga sp. TaxID=1970192 RepID=UPI002B4785EF
FSIDNGTNWQPGNIFSNLIAGDYEVIVRDGNGCLSDVSTATLNEPAPITFDTTLTNVTCNGGSDGEIEIINVAGGSGAGYEYSSDDGSNWQPGNVFSGLTAGNYNLVVRDGNGCISETVPATITEPSAIVVTLVDSLLSCGSLPVFEADTLELPDGDGDSYTSTLTFTDFDPGQTMNAGDIAGIYFDIEHSYLSDLTIELIAPDNSVILIDQAGGYRNLGYPVIGDDTDPIPGDGYLYTFDDNAPKNWTQVITEDHYYSGAPSGPLDSLHIPSGEYVPINSIDNLAGTQLNGDWTLKVTDNVQFDNGFIFKWGIRFNEQAYPSNYCNGMLEVEATGGNGGFTYQWSDGQTGPIASDLCADGYSVTATDAQGCEMVYTDSVYDVDIHMEVTDTTHVLCAGNPTGSATVVASGGNAPYTYNWSDGNTGPSNDSLSAGWYYITITDLNSCEHVDSVEIRTLYDLQIAFSDTVQITCNPENMGDSTGGITVTPTGGEPPYTYTWSSSDGNDSIATNLVAGWNYVTVSDPNCSAVDSVFLSAPAPIQIIETDHQDVLCHGDTTGSTTISVNNGAAPLTLEWAHTSELDLYTLNNLGAGDYTAMVTDNNACMEDTTITILEPAPITYNVDITPADCGVDNGTITVNNITGGDGNYSVSWSHPDWTVDSVGTSITNLGVGDYTMTIVDGNLCDTVEVITMPDNSDINVTLVNAVDPSCGGVCDGSAEINIDGGTAPFTITWSNGDTELTADSLCTGTFSVTVVDDNNCSFILTDSLQEPDPIVVDDFVYTDPIQCAGDSLADLYADVSGGTGELTYRWEDSEGTLQSLDSTLTSAIAGDTYHLTVTDDNLCELVTSIDITSMPDSIFMAFNMGQTNCPEDSTGWAAVDVTGGVGPYNYNWYKADDAAFPIVGAATDSASSLAFGYYIVEVTDALGCTVVDSVIVEANTALDFTVEILEEVTCAGNGSATVTDIVNGTGPYSYEWSSGETTETAIALNVGTNSVMLTDETSTCSVIKEFEMTDEFVFDVRIYELQPDYITGDDGNGRIRLEATGGVRPYTYEWADEDGPIADNDSLLTFLDQGWYYYTVTDDQGCTISDSAEIIETSIYIEDTVITDVSCYGYSDGAISIVPAGGVPPYSITWSNDSTGTDISGLSAGTYYLTINDVFSSYEDSLIVNEPQPYVYNNDIIEASCSGADGSITISVESGGTEPFTFDWAYDGYPELDPEGLAWAWPDDTTVTGSTIEDLHVGYYYFTLVDDNGCVAEDSVYIPDNSDFAIDPIAIDPNCLAENLDNGSITLNAENGTTPYDYTWSHDATLNNDVAANLEEGTYFATVIDDDLCVRTDNFTLTAPVSVEFEYTSTKPVCSYDTTGSITITPLQGNGEFQYAVFPTGGSPDYEPDSVFENLGTGPYTIRVIDEASCIEDKPAIIQSETSEINISEQIIDRPNCPSDENGSIAIEVEPGVPFEPFTSLNYEWTIDSATWANWGYEYDPDLYDSILSTDTIVSNVKPGINDLNPAIYSVRITTGSGCIKEENYQIKSDTSFDITNINVNLTDTSVYGADASLKTIDACKYDAISLFASPAVYNANSDLLSVDTVYWARGAGLEGYGMTTGSETAFDTATVNQNGDNYYVARIEAGRCYMEDSVLVRVPNYADVRAQVADGSNSNLFEGGGTTLEIISIPSEETSYTWTERWEVTGETPENNTLPEPGPYTTENTMIDVTGLMDSTIYRVTASTPAPYPIDGRYCETNDTVKVRVMGEFNPPSAFSPNRDGHNDYWGIQGIDVNMDFNLKIFNRWGQLVFESNDPLEMMPKQSGGDGGWDGTNMNGKDVTIGTYYYVIQYSDGSRSKKANGPVTVIR